MKRDTLRCLLPLAVVVAIGCIWSQDGAFFEWQTHRDMLRQISVVGTLACGMTVVIIAAGIDLSVGSVLGLCAVAFASLSLTLHWSAWLAIPAVLAIGALVGLVNGLLVGRFRIQAFVVTLATLVFARGLAKLLSGGRKVTTDGADLPGAFIAIDSRVLGDHVSIVTLIFAGCALVTWIGLSKLRWGRYVYAVGGNLEAARLSGVPTRLVLVSAYVWSGLLAAVAGICQAAQETHGDPETGMGYELDAIAMVVLGGTSLAGGRGSLGLTLVGALTLGTLYKVLSLNALSTEARLMLTGVILVAAVLFQRRR